MTFDTASQTYGTPTKISGVEGEWSEKLKEVGDGLHYSVSSSRHTTWDYHAGAGFDDLALDLHLIDMQSGEQARLTRLGDAPALAAFAAEAGFASCARVLASDHAWSDGARYLATNATYSCTTDAGQSRMPPTLVVYAVGEGVTIAAERTPGGYPLRVELRAIAFREGASFSWDLGDGATAAGPLVSHLFRAAGTYTVYCLTRPP